jgi:L-fuculose-phosphate aldolase
MATLDGRRRDELVAPLIEAGRFFHAEGLVDSHGGNISSRGAEAGEHATASMRITATGSMLGRLTPRELVEVSLAEEPASEPGAPAPSSDTATHVAIYRAFPDAQSVLHGHPAGTIALSLDAGRDAIEPLDLEGRHFLGRVPVIDVEWATQAEAVAEALREAPVVVTRGHGPYARGADPWDALRIISALEKSARVMLLARGRPPLPA